MLFVGSLLLLSFASTLRFSKTADMALIALRLGLLVVLSVLCFRAQWRSYHDPERNRGRAKLDMGDRSMQRWRRWFYDEPEPRS
jgi:hypothetical protein